MFQRRTILLLFVLTSFLLLSACTTKATRRFEYLSATLGHQDFDKVILAIKKEGPKLYGKKGEFLYYADLGVLFHYAGDYDSSNVYLEKSVTLFEDLFTRSLTNEAGAILSNDNVRPYRSKPYELFYIHMLMSLNYMALNQPDEALVETRRSQLLSDAFEKKDKSDEKYTDDGFFQFLSGVYYNEAGDPGNASVSLIKSIAAFNEIGFPAAPQIKKMAYEVLSQIDRQSDIQTLGLEPLDTVYGGTSASQSEIIFIGYGGRGPILGEQVFWGTYLSDGIIILHYNDEKGNEMTLPLPAPYVPDAEGRTVSLKVAMPQEKIFASQINGFTITVDNSLVQVAESANDYDLLIKRYIEDNKTKDLTRAIVRVTTRTVAAQIAKEQINTGNSILNTLLSLGTDITLAQLEQADTRSLFLIPKKLHFKRIPVTPGEHTIKVEGSTSQGSILVSKEFKNIMVRQGQKKFIFLPAFY